MKKFHVASFSKRSGISKYASDFFDLVLRDRGYVRLDYGQLGSSGENAIDFDDLVHLEIGINEEAEIELLYRLINRGHRKIDVTLHDPPFIRWPYFRFHNQVMNYTSKFIQLYLKNFFIGESIYYKIRRFFVLTRSGCRIMQYRYDIGNVSFLPQIINECDISDASPSGPSMFFFGYIAKNKGLDYALSLHERLLVDHPKIRFIVIGDAIANQEGSDYLKKVKIRYTKNVDYLGFIEDANLRKSLELASIAVLPYSAYRSIIPASASVLRVMSIGKVVCTTNVNAVSEYIQDGKNGYLLTGIFEKDINRLLGIINSPRQLRAVAQNSVDYLRQYHNSTIVAKAFDRIDV